MTLKAPPDLHLLRSKVKYDRKSGNFLDKKTKLKLNYRRSDGYENVLFEGVTYLAHRLAWYYVKGEWPPEIDHKDRNRSNTAFSNLRKCTRTENIGNGIGWGSKKKSKLPRGVFYHPVDKTRFRAQIFINRKAVHLGVFDTVAEAVEAYTIAARQHFGEFSHV